MLGAWMVEVEARLRIRGPAKVKTTELRTLR
jgi:hypothetical protein